MRYANWATALDKFLYEHAYEPFRYGSWDCCLFVCDAIQVMTGDDLAAEYRGRYSSRRAAFLELRKRAGKASVQVVAERAAAAFGMRETDAGRAQRGDMVLLRFFNSYSLGLVALNGREIVIARARGLWRVPLSKAIRVWNVA